MYDNTFVAHMKAVNSVSFVNDQDLLVTASTDCSVRLWTIQGRFIGMALTLKHFMLVESGGLFC